MHNPPVKVFISYAGEDRSIAQRLYNDLKGKGVSPWLDTEDLLLGQNRKTEISRAIKESSYFISLLSANSVTKRGYVQKELKIALDILDEFPVSEIFIIPARLDNCEPIDEKLQAIHWVDLFPSYETGLDKILRVLSLPKE
jgi:hypothetical protein